MGMVLVRPEQDTRESLCRGIHEAANRPDCLGNERRLVHAYSENDQLGVGVMGFSAGGTVTMGVSYKYDADSRPDFSAPIYAYIPGDLAAATIPSDAPALFICAATNDGLKLATHSSNLYNKWIAGGKQAELHMYAKGDHGFGMRKQNLPTDKWIERFYEWLDVQGFLQKVVTR